MSNLSEPFIKRPVMTTMLMVTIIFFGILSYRAMPVSDLPNIEYPTINITTSYPGANPITMANAVTSVLERQCATIDNVKTISSTSSNGKSSIVLQFGLNKPLDIAAQDTQTAINQATPYLPDDLPNNPVYKKVNPSSTPVMVYTLASNSVDRGTLYDYAYSLFSNRLSMVAGVSEIVIYGSQFAVRVQVDPDLLSSKNLTLEEVQQTIVAGNQLLPTGTLYGPNKEFNINVDGQIFKADGYNNLIVRNDNGSMLRVKDIGQALNSLKNDKMTVNYMTDKIEAPGVVIAILKQAGVNTVEVIEGIKAVVPRLLRELPASINLLTIFDQSLWIYMSIDDVQMTLVIAFLLVLLVTIFYFGKPLDAMIPICSLPITVLCTFIFMYLFGFSIDILSLLAITLSIGFLIDDSIVVLENIVRHVEMGEDRMTAALNGSKQVAFTVVSTSMALIAVFIPLLFMTGMIGRIFREFSATIIIAVAVSSFIALTLIPLLCSRFVSQHKAERRNWLEKFSDWLNNHMQRGYEKSLAVIMRHKFLTLLGGCASVALTVLLFIIIPKDFIPPDDLGFIQGFTVAEDGTSPYEMMREQARISETIKADPSTDAIISVGAQPYDNQSLFWVKLKPLRERPSMPECVRNIYQRVGSLVGTHIFLKPYPLINLDIGTTTQSGAYQYLLSSFDPDSLYSSAAKFISRLRQSDKIQNINADMYVKLPQIDMKIKRDMAYSFDVNANNIETALMLAYGGTKISQINAPANQYDVIMETIPSAYKNPTVLDKLYVRNQSNELVALNQVVDWKENLSPLIVNHTNTQPSVTINFDLKGATLSQALEEINSIAADVLPQNVVGEIFGAANDFVALFADLLYLCFIAIFIVYIILGVLYENFVHPLTVMSALPPAALSGLLTLFIFREPLSLYAYVGLIMLVGIVLKNGIIMIDFAIEMMNNEKIGAEEAITKSAVIRFRPIIMTTISTLMGALPIAIGIGGLTAQSRIPVGLVIVGGLIFSQVLTLFLTPVVFTTLDRVSQLFAKVRAKSAQPEHHGE
ncbi:MAG: efflux RND transporter permease subunit [Simkaniaceae bacterium]|nr:efflux RND transporter permease subunit [Simkaniaceae bacterium]